MCEKERNVEKNEKLQITVIMVGPATLFTSEKSQKIILVAVQRSEKMQFPLKHPAKNLLTHFFFFFFLSDLNPLLYAIYSGPDSGSLTDIIASFLITTYAKGTDTRQSWTFLKNSNLFTDF